MSKMLKYFLVLAALLSSGCLSDLFNGTVDNPPISFVSNRGDSNRVAICVGLTLVKPSSYGGWNGECPGCDVDARSLHNLFVTNGFTSRMMLNSEATWRNVRKAIIDSVKNMNTNSLLVVAMSGHGGQIKDDNGDEADGIDETICLWDGQVRDDEVLKMIHEFPKGIRLVLINDQCHSEGNFRSMVRVAQRVVSLGFWGARTAVPVIEREDNWKGQLIQFAGCREASYSYGAERGGTWTQSLLGVLNTNMSWISWFEQAKSIMPNNQVPQWVEYGDVQDYFRYGNVLK